MKSKLRKKANLKKSRMNFTILRIIFQNPLKRAFQISLWTILSQIVFFENRLKRSFLCKEKYRKVILRSTILISISKKRIIKYSK